MSLLPTPIPWGYPSSSLSSQSAVLCPKHTEKKLELQRMVSPLTLLPFELSFLIALLLIPIYLLLKTIKRSSSQTIPPCPPKLPIIGNIHQLGSLPHRSLRDLSDKYGSLMFLRLGSVPTLVVSSADAARDVMKTHDLVFASRPSLKLARILIYNSKDLAFSPYGEHWRQMRKVCVTHLLNNKMVESFGVIRQEEVALMVDKVSSMSSKVVDVGEVLYSFSNDVTCRVVSGNLREEGRNVMFRELIQENLHLLGKIHIEDFLPRLAWLDVFLGLTARAKRHFRRWDELLERTITEHDERSKERWFKKEDFVDTLLALQKADNAGFAFTKDHIKALLLDMFVGGIDTSYIVMEWALTELVRHPEVMNKLQSEVRRLATGKPWIKEEELNQMSYLKAVVKETLRLHPPVPLLVPRESMEDCSIQGYDIPKKSRIIINAWAIGRDPKIWEAPEEFQPERFVNSSIDFRGNDFQFIPFGAGRRVCPGINFAVSTIELALANLVYKFNWELPNGMKIEDVDMAEAPGLSTRKKLRLNLIAKPYVHEEE